MSLFFDDYTSFAPNHLRILTKEGTLVRFYHNQAQQYLWNIINKQRKNKLPVRCIVLKARQMGISTFTAGFVYHRTIHNPYVKSLIIAHDSDSTDNIFNMCKRFYDFTDPFFRPLKRYSNRKELVFENPDDKTRDEEPGLLSQIVVETAGKKTAGRSATVHNLHISELAFWPNAKETYSGLTQSIANRPGTSIIIESTANGMDGDGKFFYDFCMRSNDLKNDFELVFIPWFKSPEYSLDRALIDPTEEELDLKDLYKLSDNQLAWRRHKIDNDFHGDVEVFKQEYPSSIHEAFIFTGRPVFDVEYVTQYIAWLEKKRVQQSIKVGDLDSEGKFVESLGGCLKIYEPPLKGNTYCIGADVAEGIEGGDYSTAFVLDKQFRQVAQYKGHIDPDLFGKYLVALARHYNDALLAPEINNHGHATLAAIKNLQYSNIYKLEVHDEIADKIQIKLGWRTTSKTKMKMLDDFKAVVRDNSLKIRDIELYKEMRTLQVEANGDVQLTGKDLVVSACIAVQALKQTPEVDKYGAFNPEKEATKGRLYNKTFAERMKIMERASGMHYD